MSDVRALAAGIKALLFDVDGVLTDGGMFTDEDGRVMKRFDVRDGAGLKFAREVGLVTGIISGHDSAATRARAKMLGLDHCMTGVERKELALAEILKRTGLDASQVLYMGDDYVDIPVLAAVGLAVSVPHAPAAVKAVCRYVTTAPAGHGAVREAIEIVLAAGGHVERLLKRYGAP